MLKCSIPYFLNALYNTICLKYSFVELHLCCCHRFVNVFMVCPIYILLLMLYIIFCCGIICIVKVGEQYEEEKKEDVFWF